MWLSGPSFIFGALALDVLAPLSLAVASTTTRASVVGVTEIQQHDRGQSQSPKSPRVTATAGDSSHFAATNAGALDAAAAAAAVKQDNGGSATTHRQLEISSPAASGADGPPQRRAYATLLYSDFVEGTRALGQSLRESGTTADIVVLVTPDVKQETRERLTRDGWIVRPVAVEANPNENFQSRLVFVYTKLLIVEMEDEYDRIVFLDADTLVLENIDELFECEPFCAVMRHSELLNSGVVVITPSRELYRHMHGLIGELDSYTGGDQGFLNSFYPYFAACPAFEPYPIVGSRLPGVGSGIEEVHKGRARKADRGRRALDSGFLGMGEGEAVAAAGFAGDGTAVVVSGEERRGLAKKEGEWVRPKGWGCKRLPTRYNGDWPLLFVDGDLQVVQGKEAGPEAPADWKRRKKVKVLHFTFGTAKPWDWWTYPFLPYVDLWLEAFYRIDGKTGQGSEQGDWPHLGTTGDKANNGSGGSGNGRAKRPRWSGVMGQVVYGLGPLVVVAALWRAANRWTAARRALRNTGIALARYTIPVNALNARSLVGSIFNLSVGLVLALSAAVLAFKAVPAARLGAARPEAAWAFFLGRATALMVLSEGCYLVLVSLKAHRVFKALSLAANNGAPYSSVSALDHDAESSSTNCLMMPMAAGGAGTGRRVVPSSSSSSSSSTVQPAVQLTIAATGGGGAIAEGTGKNGGASVGGPCRPRGLVLTETVAHLAFLSAMAAMLVSSPLWVGLNGFPASREIVPGIARLLGLLALFTFSAVRLPPLWASRARSYVRSCSNTSGSGSSSRSGSGDKNSGSSNSSSSSSSGGVVCGGWHRGRQMARADRMEMLAERAALRNLSPLSDHHSA